MCCGAKEEHDCVLVDILLRRSLYSKADGVECRHVIRKDGRHCGTEDKGEQRTGTQKKKWMDCEKRIRLFELDVLSIFFR